MFRGFSAVVLTVAIAALAQESGAPGPALVNAGSPMKLRFVCDEEDLAAAGMSCSDDAPCPIYLELSGVSAFGKKLLLAGDLHGPVTTLYSVLLSSEDDGVHWKEPVARVPGAALEQVQLLDSSHGWAAGENQVPLVRDPFFLITSDGGDLWRRAALSDDGSPGAVQRFWFDSPVHGELVIDSGRTAAGGRYALYESHTGGDSWTIESTTTQMPRLRRAPSVDNPDYRVTSNSAAAAYVIEKRSGETWTPLASFLVQVASCGTRPPPPEAEPEPMPATDPAPDAK